MSSELKSKMDSWRLVRQLTYDLLKSLSEKLLKKTVSKNMGSIGKQFRHIGDVQLCYNKAIITGKIDFSKYRRDYSIENSKIKLKQFLEEMDEEMYLLIEKNNNVKIDWGFAQVSLINHLNFLIQHEILRQGELIVYMRSLELRFPKSWEDIWGPLNVS